MKILSQSPLKSGVSASLRGASFAGKWTWWVAIPSEKRGLCKGTLKMLRYCVR